MTSTRRLRLQGIVVLAVVFTAGGLLGATGERLRASRAAVVQPEDGRGDRPRNRGGRRGLRPGELPSAFQRLDLSDGQRARILEIFESHRPRTETVMQEVIPRLRAITDSVRVQIDSVLTEAQRTQLRDELGGWPPREFRRGRFGPRPDGERGSQRR